MITTSQLRALGLGDARISRWVRAGRLFAVHRGVFAVGRRDLTPRGEWRAAVAAMGEAVWLSHCAAVEIHGWRTPITLPVHLTTVRDGLRQRKGLVLHYASSPPSATTRWGLPVTAAARTIADMAALLPTDRALVRLCGQAGFAKQYDRRALLAELGDGRAGAARLRRVLATLDIGGGHTRSELEDALRVLIGRHAIAPPLFNEPLDDFVADALWPEAGLVVELDSRLAHDSEPAFFTDREKDLVYAEHGFECLRLTWRQVVGQPERISRLLRSRVGIA